MNLRNQSLAVIAVTLSVLVAGLYHISSSTVRRSFDQLETESVLRNLNHANVAFTQLQADLNARTRDWASRDDTVRLLENHGPGLTRTSLTGSVIEELNIDAMAVVDGRGRISTSRTAPAVESAAPLSVKNIVHELNLDRVPGKNTAAEGINGVISEQGALALVSAQPVLAGRTKGACRGWIVFARCVTPEDIAHLGKRTCLALNVRPLGAATVNETGPGAKNAGASLSAARNAATLVAPDSDFQVSGYSYIRDVAGKPVAMLQVSLPRGIYQQGLKTQSMLVRLILSVTAVFTLLLLLFMERRVLSRLASLTEQVGNIGQGKFGTRQVEVPGRDELSRLAAHINQMLASLQTGAERLRASQIKLRKHSESLEERVQERTRELESKTSVLENAVEGIAHIDADGRYISVNRAYAAMMGYAPEEMIGLTWEETVFFDDAEERRRACAEMHLKGRAERETQGPRKDRTLFHQQILLLPAHGDTDEQNGFYCFLKDITERKALESQLAHQAFHDTLTGLPNRALMIDRLSHALSKTGRNNDMVGVLFMDLDNFKIVNDSLGHEAGDHLLMQVAKRLERCLRPGDTAARLGGDEFTVLLEGLTETETALEVARRITAEFHTPVKAADRDFFVTCSIGVACGSAETTTPERLLRDADTAMYVAKTSGKANFVQFDVSMNESAMERLELETELRQALDREEFCVYYQPIVHLRTGTMSGVEALVRWDHPRHGIIPPAKFIPIAEETGLIVPLGFWVLEHSCRQAVRWRDERPGTPPLIMSVNLSARQLQLPDLVQRVQAIIDKTGIDPRLLKLEITESVMMNDVEGTIAKLQDLKQMGVLLAVDDFGTGYSSMSYLSRLPIDTLKIDRSFVDRLGRSDEADAIVRAILNLARSLNLDVTSEGIETRQQLDHLKGEGSDLGQGYLFAKPLSSYAIWNLLTSASQSPNKAVQAQESEPSLRDLQGHRPTEEKRAA